MTKIGLVTVLFNSNDVLEGFLKSLSNQTFNNYHLYIIDNTPAEATDNLLAQLLVRHPVAAYSHLKSSDNFGIAKGNNIGTEAALNDGCNYILLLNNDIEFSQADLLKEMVAIAEAKKEVLLVPKILFFDNKKIWMAGGHFYWWKAMGSHIGEGHDDGPLYNKEAHINYAPTCFMLVHSSVFKAIGMMDERYFAYFDDTDFVYRAVKKGYKIYYYPQFNVLHKVGGSTGGYDSNFSIFYGNRNRIYFIKKHYGVIKKIIAYSIVLITRIMKYLKYNTLQRKEFIKAIKAGFNMDKIIN